MKIISLFLSLALTFVLAGRKQEHSSQKNLNRYNDLPENPTHQVVNDYADIFTLPEEKQLIPKIITYEH